MTEETIPNFCGSCTLCCKLLGIEELSKPQDKWCPNCAVGKGCKTYETRPQSCADYKCAWRQTQTEATPWGPEYRPDRLGVIFDSGGLEGDKVLCLRVHPNDASHIQRKPVQAILGACEKNGITVFIVSGDKRGIVSVGTASGRTGLSDQEKLLAEQVITRRARADRAVLELDLKGAK